MNIFLASLVVALAALFARDGVSEKGRSFGFRISRGLYVAIIVLAILTGGAYALLRTSPDVLYGSIPAFLGAFAGVLAAVVAFTLGSTDWQKGSGRTAPIALAALAISALASLQGTVLLASVLGAAAAAWIMSLKAAENPWGVRTAVYMGCIATLDLIGSYRTPAQVGLGEELAMIVTIAGIIAIGVGALLAAKKPNLAFFTSILLLALNFLGAYLLFRKVQLDSACAFIFLAALVVAVLSDWLIGQEAGTEIVRMLLSVILWIALATAAFGYDKGFGMSIALMAGAGALLVTGRNRALLCMAPLAALVVYRVFRQMHADTAEAFDIGQHYGEIGFVLGVILPVMAQEWLRNARTSRPWIGGSLWILLLVAAPLPISVALSDKGIVGYLVGLGIAPVLEAVRGDESIQPVSLVLGLSCGMALLYNWIQPHLDIDRHGKIVALSWIAGIMALAVIGIILTSRSKQLKEAGAVA